MVGGRLLFGVNTPFQIARHDAYFATVENDT